MKKTLESLFVVVAMFLAISCTKDEANPFGTIFGTVTDSQTMEPIQGAKVTLTPSGKSTVTGNDGTYELVDLEAGSYKITVQASGYQSTLKNITVLAGERALGDVSLQPTAKQFCGSGQRHDHFLERKLRADADGAESRQCRQSGVDYKRSADLGFCVSHSGDNRCGQVERGADFR